MKNAFMYVGMDGWLDGLLDGLMDYLKKLELKADNIND